MVLTILSPLGWREVIYGDDTELRLWRECLPGVAAFSSAIHHVDTKLCSAYTGNRRQSKWEDVDVQLKDTEYETPLLTGQRGRRL